MSDDDPVDYQAEWESLSERDLLEGIFIELTQIRALLSQLAENGEPGDSGAASVYECDRCNATVKPGEREQHAVGQHSAPVDMVDSLFSER